MSHDPEQRSSPGGGEPPALLLIHREAVRRQHAVEHEEIESEIARIGREPRECTADGRRRG